MKKARTFPSVAGSRIEHLVSFFFFSWMLLIFSPSNSRVWGLVSTTAHRAATRRATIATTTTQLHEGRVWGSISSSSSDSMDIKIEKKETVAIIGGGIAGLSCAHRLGNSGRFEHVTVFDTGRLRPGGRCSSRLPDDAPTQGRRGAEKGPEYLRHTIVDHAAQIVTIPASSTNPEFAQQMLAWEKQGIVQQYRPGTVCEIGNPYNRQTKQHDQTKIAVRSSGHTAMYYGTNGMQSIPEVLSATGNFTLEQDVWVSPSNGVKLVPSSPQNGGKDRWEVKAKGQVLGRYDKLVIAHNGKCADRLMSKTPAKQFHKLLQVNFAPYVPKNGGTRMTLNSIYSLVFAIEKNSDNTSPLSHALGPAHKFTCGFIKNHPNLRFVSCNTRKYPLPNNEQDHFEVWTVLSSAKFGKAFKGPQEALPKELVQKVTHTLLTSVEEALVLPAGSLTATNALLETKLQLWGAGVPLNTWVPKKKQNEHTAKEEEQGFIYDGEYGVGACGDWLLDPSIAGAWESGRRLADYMAKTTASPSSTSLSIGLEGGTFKASSAVDKAGIGSLQ